MLLNGSRDFATSPLPCAEVCTTLYSFLNALGLATTQINKGISPCDWERTMSSNLGEKAHEVACSLLKNRAVPGKVAHLCDAVYLIS